MSRKAIHCLVILSLLCLGQSVLADLVDLELILATDTSGSVDGIDFAARRSGIEAAFRDADVIETIENGAIGAIAVALWDFGTTTHTALDWAYISNAGESNAFADAVALAGRLGGGGDGQAELLRQATTALGIDNGYEGTRFVVDITSEGVQSGEGGHYTNPWSPATRAASDNFIAAGGSAVNAIWMRDRNFFGIHAGATVNALEYGTLSVIGGAGSFQVFAETNDDFVGAIKNKLIREVGPPVPVPGAFLLGSIGLGFSTWRLKRRKMA